MTTKTKKLDVVWQGLWDTMQQFTMNSPLAGSDFQNTPERALYTSGINYAPYNGVIELQEPSTISQAQVDHTLNFFLEKQVPFLWWAQEQNILSNKEGFQFGGKMRGIAVELSKTLPQKQSKHITIKQITTEQDCNIFSDIMEISFGVPLQASKQCNQINLALMKKGINIHYLAYVDNVPAGGVTLSVCESSSGIWNFATLPAFRRKGVGLALVNAALAEAKKRQYKNVMAILMPKGMAAGVFAQHGFKEICDLPFYIYGSTDPLEK